MALPVPSFGDKNKTMAGPEHSGAEINTLPAKTCGTSTASDMKNPFSYENDAVLICLGDSASRCEDARAVFSDDLFPTIFQIMRDRSADQNICRFRLSYGADSALVDVIGGTLAGRYISCPLDIVKAINESDPQSPTFESPSIDNPGKYAGQIYFYGILGVFMENDADPSKIKDLGCSGPYIDSIVASYNNR